MKSILTWCVTLTLTWSFPAFSSDREPTETEKNEAARAFKTGQALSEKGQYLEAAAAFEKAYRLHSHPSVLANIGQCYRAAGDYPKAVEAFRQYFERPNPDVPEFNEEVKKTLEKLETEVGDLVIAGSTKDCLVNVDGVPRGVTPLSLVLAPGAHTVDVECIDQGKKGRFQVTLRAGRKTLLEANFLRDGSDSPRDGSDSPGLRAPFWVVTATAILGAGAAGVLGGLNLKTIRDYRKGGSRDPSLQERGNRLNLATNITGGIAGALVVTAIILAVVDLKRKPDEDDWGRKTAFIPELGVNFKGEAYVGLGIRFH